MTWTDPATIAKWFTPSLRKNIQTGTDARAGGSSLTVMEGPDGTEMANRGVYVEVLENKRRVFTDVYTQAWKPSAKPFMTGILTVEGENGGTRYTARVCTRRPMTATPIRR